MTTDKPFSISIKINRLKLGSNTLFQNIDFTLKMNEWTCLLGPSGVGKTTLLRIFANLITDPQNVIIKCSDQLPLQGRVAYMSQEDLLLPWLNILENVLIGYRLRREKDNRSEAHKLLALVGLEHNISDMPSTLSGGMRQRVALARTMIENKPVVLMDEPFSNLDAISKIHMQDMAAKLLSNRTVLLITHDPLEALRLGDTIYVLGGRPVKFSNAIKPPGKRPRSIADTDLHARQAELLTRLATAHQKDSI